jgi:ABC-type glycerol-3-phosphate transport system substrate-binding protein
MKRLIPLLLVFLFLFAAACGNAPSSPAGTDSPAAPTPDTRYVRWAVTEEHTWPLACADADYGWSTLCLLGEVDGQPVLLYGGTEPQSFTPDRSYALAAAGPDCAWLAAEKELVRLDADGNRVLSLTLSEKVEDMTCDGAGNLWAAHKNALTLVNTDGSTETVALPQGFTAGTLCRLGSGGIGVFASRVKGDAASVYRLSAEDLEPKVFEGAVSIGLIYPGDDTAEYFYYVERGLEHYLSGGKQLFRFSGDESAAVLDLAGLGREGLLLGIYPEGADFLVLYRNGDTAGLLRLTRTEVEKRVITMARLESNHINTDLIDRFNAANPEYYLVSRSYGSEDELHLDILAGDRPDLLSGMCVSTEIYAAKGLLADLYPYLEQEPELAADLVPSVLNALETGDGKLTQLCPDYILYTCAVLKRYAGDADRWTLADMERICAENPELTLWGAERGKKLLDVLLCGILDRFANLEKQELHFDSPEFIAFLDFLQEMDQRAQSFSGSYDFGDGDFLLCVENFTSVAGPALSGSISGFAQAMAQLDAKPGLEELRFIGFPTEGGTGCRIYATSLFSVLSGTGNEDAAWTFLRWTLEDEVQETLTTYIPIRKSVLEAQLTQAGEGTPETVVTRYRDPAGAAAGTNTETYTVTIPAVPGLTEEELDLFRDLLDRAEGLYQDARIHPCYELIYRECAGLFNGQKTAAETAASIQSKMAIYLAERAG